MAVGPSCESIPVDWDPLVPGSPPAVLATTLAGFIVACLVAAVIERGRPHRGEILGLLGSALACLVVAGVIGTAINREPSCLLGWAQNMFATALMSVGAVGVCCGLAWLLLSYLGPEPLLLSAGRWGGYAMIVIVTLFQAFNGQRFLLDATGGSSGRDWIGWFVVAYPPLTLAALVLVRARWQARPARLAGRSPSRLDRPPRIAAIVAAGLALTSLLVAVVVAGRPGSDDGVAVPTWVVQFAVAIPLLLATGSTLALAYAWPHPASRLHAGSAATQPSGDHSPRHALVRRRTAVVRRR